MNYLDFLLLVPIAFAGLNGYRKGLVVTLFGFMALVLACMITFKLSNTIIQAINPDMKHNARTVLGCYIIIFIVTYLLVDWSGKFITRIIKLLQLGILNRIGGAIFGVIKICFFLSLLLWLTDKAMFFSPDTTSGSVVYAAIHELGPQILGFLSTVIPFMDGLLKDVEALFDRVKTALL